MNRKAILFPISALLAFIIPLYIVLSNIGYYLGFADAAEFALVTKIAGIAHPPGFPSYVLSGKAWSILMEVMRVPHIKGMIWFSVFSTATATLLLFITFHHILKISYPDKREIMYSAVSLIAALSFVAGVTAWHWSGNVEVYSFQVLSFSIMLLGLTYFNIQKRQSSLYIAALGIALGLANHHLTMILFLPFVLFFFQKDLFKTSKYAMPQVIEGTKRKEKKIVVKGPSLMEILKSKNFLILASSIFVITAIFYGWMFIRAGADLPFKFGNPNSLSRFLYHVMGGAWIKNTEAEVKGLVGLRFPYFMNLSFEQLFLFLPFLILGIRELIRRRNPQIIYICMGYYLLMLLYQLRIDQTSDTDAYMLPSFFMLCLLILFGIMSFISINKYFIYILPLVFFAQVLINYPRTDKRDFNISETLMREIDRSSPPNSTILIADWTTVIQYYYHRIAENFRPDLVVLNYDLKFTNYEILKQVYPEFYKEIKPEYDHFVELLGQAHPQEIYNTGCTMDNPPLMNSYIAVISKMKDRCVLSNTAFMCDPKAYIFLMQNGLMSTHAIVSGCFVSTVNTGRGHDFLKLDYAWLNSPLLMKEPSATDKMVDLEAALDFNRNYFKSTGNDELQLQAEKSYERIKELQRKMKRNMPFVYRN